ncbi:MAG: bis(5'-nucleosyl)-tetraphosphatase (symmetrical) YqeK [Clostridia bacterium]|nr:bis(5'-nucleosyl)-tetraphosphatase (symmetrical) YqeK [Clostridia bacterium]
MLSQVEIKDWLQTRLSEKRFSHSLGVAQEAERLAKHYGADPQKAYLAGLVHDCAKEVSKDETMVQLSAFDIVPDVAAAAAPWLLHGTLGACVAKQEFGIEDEEILDAIRYHTTGKADMSLLARIIFIADFIEPGRTYPDVAMLREMTYQNLEEAMLFGIDYTIELLVKKKMIIHPDTIHCRNDLMIELTAKGKQGIMHEN